MRRPLPRRLDQRGVALSSSLALLSAGAVLLAAAAFVATDGQRGAAPAAVSARTAASATPTGPTGPTAVATQRSQPKRTVRKKPPVRRGDTYVEVFNNTGVKGLAGSTAARAAGAGWQVVGSDNWYGTIPGSTVYYPARLRDAATLLGKDLGIARVKPIIAPMRGDRLTVILTTDYS